MGKIVYFDYCAFFLLLILLLTTIYRRMFRGKANQYFLLLVGVVTIATLADICAVNLDNMGAGNLLWKNIFHTLYLYCHSISCLLYVCYLFALTDTWHILRKNRLVTGIVFLPNLVLLAVLFLNFFNGKIFYFDANDQYQRGSWFMVLYALAFFYVLYGSIYLFRFRKSFSVLKFVILLFYFTNAGLAAAAQYFLPKHIVEMFFGAIAMTFISMMVQRPEEMIDSETGFLNLQTYVSSMHNANRNKKPMQIVMLNISNYNTVSEMLGYDKRTMLLRSISYQLDNLNQTHKLGAELFYLGQGKFRVVIDDLHFDKTEEIANLVNRALYPEIIIEHVSVNVLTQVCITRFPEDIDDADSLLAFGTDLNSRAYTGEVLYASEIFKKEHYDLMRDIDRIMERALVEHKFEVYYQPIFSVEEQRFNSAEALLRLKDDKYGFISPEIFIPAAEKSGAIHKIGSFVLEEVCKFIASDEFKTLGIDYIEINLSVAQCMQSTLAKDILATLDLYNVSPRQINLEITETAASYSQKAMLNNLRVLTEAGISFSLDDYGTGYSNMQRIATMPLHIVKLDKSFTNYDDNPKMISILQNTINMIKDMNLKIVVEGIETESMMRQFSDMKCEYIQGYFYSKPVTKQEFIDFILSYNNKMAQ